MKEFMGFGGYSRPAEGFLSWQHLTFVTSLMIIMVATALYLGRKNRNASEKQKNRVLIAAALLIDGFEIFKITVLCLRSESWDPILGNLPLFLCSIQLISIPLAAFSKGRIREAALDFVCIFGVLGAVLGTYGAGQNYGCYPVLSMDNVVSGITHSISGFTAIYIFCARLSSMKERNIGFTYGILGVFCVLAYIANQKLGTNYMFLRQGDGTPYDIFYNLVGGSPVLYPTVVIGLFLVYVGIFYLVHHFTRSNQKAAV